MKATALLGRIVNVGRLAGTKAEFDFDLHALRRIDYIGVTFRTRTLDEVREIGRRMRADLWDAVTAGKLKLPIDRRFPLDEAPQAHAHMRANTAFRQDRADDVMCPGRRCGRPQGAPLRGSCSHRRGADLVGATLVVALFVCATSSRP